MPQYIRKLVLKHEDESLEQYETRVNKEKDDSIKKKIGF